MAEEAHKESSLVGGAIESLAGSIQHFIDGASHGGGGHGHGDETFIQKWLGLHSWVEYLRGHGITGGFTLLFVYLALIPAGTALLPEFPLLMYGWLLLTFPIIATVGMAIGTWGAWKWYVQSHFIFAKTKPILLEVKMPTEITKSPRAMELFLTSLWIRMSRTTAFDKWWKGGVLPYFSLELASHGGEVHFYIWSSRDFLRNAIEANFYAQYPEVEIVEVSDYSIDFPYDDSTHQAFVGDQIFETIGGVSRHDEAINAYPIKTYVDFELDKDPKEELKVEPFAQVLEVLSSMNKEEEAWVQIVMQGHFTSHWKKLVEAEIKKIRKLASLSPGKEDAPESDERKYGFPRPTWKEQELMKAMERNLGKLPFDFGARMIYIAPRGKMRGAEYTALRWLWRPFANPNYQVMLRPRNAHNDFDWPWQDWYTHRWDHETHRYLDAYRRRQMFYPPWEDVRNITSVEVLATLWHPPSSTIKTPGLQRIPSAKSEPPPNLPV